MKRRQRMSKKIRKRIESLRQEIERLPEYVLQEIRANPTEPEKVFMEDIPSGSVREHETGIRW